MVLVFYSSPVKSIPHNTIAHARTMVIGAEPAGRVGQRRAGGGWVAAWGLHPPAALGQGK